jgi:RNA polymerase sigma-70 factor (ECF subfamily)
MGLKTSGNRQRPVARGPTAEQNATGFGVNFENGGLWACVFFGLFRPLRLVRVEKMKIFKKSLKIVSVFGFKFDYIVEADVWELLLNGRSIKDLVAACRAGDESAREALVRACGSMVLAVCLGMVGNVDDAEDLAQETLLTGLAELSRLREDERFRPWIARIAKCLCTDFLRQRKIEREAMREQAQTASRGTQTHPQLQQLPRVLARLPHEYRLILVLYYFDDRSISGVAEVLKISEAAVQTRLCRARRKLRGLLDAHGGV